MTAAKFLALLLLLNAALFVVRAQEPEEDAAPDADEDFGDAAADEDNGDSVTGMLARAYFADQDATLTNPIFPAGEKILSRIALANDLKNPNYTVFFVNGFISRLGDFSGAIQNFSGVRQEAVVSGGETTTFGFTFQPDKNLEPMDYNLVLRVFFSTDANKTFVAVGYNGTVSISDPLGADPKTFATFATIAAIIGAVAYAVNLRRKKTFKPRSAKPSTEAGTKDNTYDPAYISEEHTRFRDAILRKNTPSPTKKK